MRHSERHNCATSDMRSNSRKLRRQKECRSQIGTRRMSDRDCRSDSSRPHLLTARTHGGVVSVTSRRGVSARCLRGLMLALGSPIVKPAARQTVTHHLDRLITTTQPAHSTIPGLPSRSSGAHGGLTGDPHRILKPRYQPLHAFLGEMNTITADLDAVDLGRVNAVWTKLFVEVDHSDVRVLANGVM